MTQPNTQTLVITRGDDFSATVTFDQDISGASEIRFTVRDDWATSETDNASAVYTTTLAPTGTTTASLTVPDTDTVTWLKPGYVYDIQITTGAGLKQTTQLGSLRMGPDVTR